ncbi:MAG: hypothetical protein JKY66_00030, partial [Spongiibacteraceae bacterium]|nr:hypothetical protein [Spongiibacteraceae bacterium]
MKAFDLPLSGLMTEHSKKMLAEHRVLAKEHWATAIKCPAVADAALATIAAV